MAFDIAGAFNSILGAMITNPAFLLILIVFLFMIPLSLMGTIKIYEWFNTWTKLRAGFIKVRKKLSNGRWVSFWARPTGRKVAIKGEEGMEFDLPVKIEKGFMGYENNIKGNFKEASKDVD